MGQVENSTINGRVFTKKTQNDCTSRDTVVIGPSPFSTTLCLLFRFLGSTFSQDLKSESNTDTIIKKAQQRMYVLHQLTKLNLLTADPVLHRHYSVCSLYNGQITGANLLSIQDLSRVRKQAQQIHHTPDTTSTPKQQTQQFLTL